MREFRKPLILKIMTDTTDKLATHPDERPLSPCILICTLDEDKQCLGCARTLDEISNWALMTAEQQWQVVDALPQRRAGNSATIAAEAGES